MRSIDFWYDFGSTYSYPAAMRIEAMADEAGVTVQWRPFLLGVIFRDQGLTTSPFVINKVKGRYMWRDMQRICAEHGLPFQAPDPFPQNSMLAARIALTDGVSPQRAAFTRHVYDAAFGEGARISEESVMATLLAELGFEPQSMLSEAKSETVKQRLRDETAEAQRIGLFGAPSFVLPDGEVFWGHDRLERALAWAKGRGLGRFGTA